MGASVKYLRGYPDQDTYICTNKYFQEMVIFVIGNKETTMNYSISY